MPKNKEANFEQSMERLNAIVEKLEGGEISLDESLKLYEEGVQITQVCSKRLDTAQSRVEMLVRSASGEVQTEPIDAKNLKPKTKKGRKAS